MRALRAALVARRLSSSTASSAPPQRARASVPTLALRAFIAGATLVACDTALDDYVLYGVALDLARERSTMENDPRLRAALGEGYGVDRAWWNASVSRAGRGAVARVEFALSGERASCDVRVTMTRAEDGRGHGGILSRVTPASAAHAMAGARAWRVAAVECTLPTERGGGRSALVSLAREDVNADAETRASPRRGRDRHLSPPRSSSP